MNPLDDAILTASLSPHTYHLLVDKLDTAAELIGHARQDTARQAIVGTLTDLDRLIGTAQSAMRTTVALLRQQGASWTAIGHLLNITRQAAQQRFSD